MTAVRQKWKISRCAPPALWHGAVFLWALNVVKALRANTVLQNAAPALSILVGSSVWGIAWYPYRLLGVWGMSALVAQTLAAFVAAVFVSLVYRKAFATLRFSWVWPAIVLVGGLTNVGFVWGVTHGHVMRVLLLFYLAPVWTALFAHLLLGERLTLAGTSLVLLALGGAGLMLWTPETGWPVPANAAEWAGLVAGAAFAANNVLMRRASQIQPGTRPEMRSWVLYVGGVAAGLLAIPFDPAATVEMAPLSAHMTPVAVMVVGLGVVLALTNITVQFGLARVPANRVALIMLFEIVVAAISSWLLAGEVLGMREFTGGVCITAAGALSGLLPENPRAKAPKAGDAVI